MTDGSWFFSLRHMEQQSKKQVNIIRAIRILTLLRNSKMKRASVSSGLYVVTFAVHVGIAPSVVIITKKKRNCCGLYSDRTKWSTALLLVDMVRVTSKERFIIEKSIFHLLWSWYFLCEVHFLSSVCKTAVSKGHHFRPVERHNQSR